MSSSSLVVPVAGLRRQVGSSQEVRGAERFDFLDPEPDRQRAAPGGSWIEDSAVLDCDVRLESFLGGVMVSGTVRTTWKGVCRRCAVPVGGRLTARVRERFTEAGGTARDEDAYPMGESEIDLGPMARDAALLELPLAPLCSPTCLGLCVQCGADLNEGSCGCAVPRDPRWANLDVLRSPR